MNLQAKFLLPVLLFWTIIQHVSAQQHPWPPEGEKGKDYFINSTEKPNGLHYRTYGDGKIYYSGEFLNKKPKPSGYFYYYHQNGKVMAMHRFEKNIDRVHANIFNDEGFLMSRGLFLKQKKDSVWTFYDKTGSVTSREGYKNDLKEGKSLVYYPGTDKLVEESIYKNGKLEGEQVQYFPNGKKRLQGNYIADKREGKFTEWTDAGAKDSEGDYKSGLKEGVWSFYLPTGRLEKRVKFENGEAIKVIRENGDFIDYFPNGVPQLEISYKDGKRHGPFKEYFEMGEFVKIQESVQGGGMQWKEKLVGTQVKTEGDYMNDLLEGEITHYNDKGRIVKVEIYQAGELIETQER